MAQIDEEIKRLQKERILQTRVRVMLEKSFVFLSTFYKNFVCILHIEERIRPGALWRG